MNKVTQSIYKKKVDNLEEGGGGGGGSTKYYKHCIRLNSSDTTYSITALVEVYTKSSTGFNIDTFKAAIPNLFLVVGPNCDIPASGIIRTTIAGSNKVLPVCQATYNQYASALAIIYVYNDGQLSVNVDKLSDTVKEVV